MRLERRPTQSFVALLLAPLGAIAVTLVISSLLLSWAGAPIARTWGLLLEGAFGSVFAWSETLTRAIPLILTGLAATVAFKARLFNIGAAFWGLVAGFAVSWWMERSDFGRP